MAPNRVQQRSGRSGVEVGALIAGLIFMLGLAFQAGVQYGETQNLKASVVSNKESINHIEDQAQSMDSRMSHVEQLLSDIKESIQARGYKQ